MADRDFTGETGVPAAIMGGEGFGASEPAEPLSPELRASRFSESEVRRRMDDIRALLRTFHDEPAGGSLPGLQKGRMMLERVSGFARHWQKCWRCLGTGRITPRRAEKFLVGSSDDGKTYCRYCDGKGFRRVSADAPLAVDRMDEARPEEESPQKETEDSEPVSARPRFVLDDPWDGWEPWEIRLAKNSYAELGRLLDLRTPPYMPAHLVHVLVLLYLDPVYDVDREPEDYARLLDDVGVVEREAVSWLEARMPNVIKVSAPLVRAEAERRRYDPGRRSRILRFYRPGISKRDLARRAGCSEREAQAAIREARSAGCR